MQHCTYYLSLYPSIYLSVYPSIGLSILLVMTNSTVNNTLCADALHHFQLFLDLVDDALDGGSVSSVATHTGFNRSWAAGCRHTVLMLPLYFESKRKKRQKEKQVVGRVM